MLHNITIGNRRHGDVGEYVGRPGALGNPYVVGVHGSVGECIAPYRVWLWEQLRDEESAAARALDALRETARARTITLVCWCHPGPCHAEVIRDALLWLDAQEAEDGGRRLDELGAFSRLGIEIEGEYR